MSTLIDKVLSAIPSSSNYTRPLPVPEVKKYLRGDVYDPFLRKLLWKGVGVGAYTPHARWTNELGTWILCPYTGVWGQRWIDTLRQAVRICTCGAAWAT